MTTGSETSVRDALAERGFDLSDTEVKKVETNYLRLRAIYDGIRDWTPPKESRKQP